MGKVRKIVDGKIVEVDAPATVKVRKIVDGRIVETGEMGQPEVKKKDTGGQETSQSGSLLKSTSEKGNEYQGISPFKNAFIDLNIAEAEQKSSSIIGGESFTLNLLKSYKKGTGPISLKPSPQSINDYKEYDKFRENQIDDLAKDVYSRAYLGYIDHKGSELQELSAHPKGKEYLKKIVDTFGGNTESIDSNDPDRFEKIAREIIAGNRSTGVEKIREHNRSIDQEISKYINNAWSGMAWASGGTGGGSGGINYSKISTEDINDISELGRLHSLVSNSAGLTFTDGGSLDPQAKNNLLNLLDQKSKILARTLEMSDEINNLQDKIKSGVLRATMTSERGEDIRTEDFAKDDLSIENHFKIGLNYIKNFNPARYSNIINTLEKKERVSEKDFVELSKVGQEIENDKIFEGAAENPDLIGKETDIDYSSRQEKKAVVAAQIGEYLKFKGYNNVREFNKDTIVQAAKDIGISNMSIVEELAGEEQLIGYDAIPKTGWRQAITRGVQMPLEGIRKTYEVATSSDADIYLRSQAYDAMGLGGQLVVGKEGQLGQRLPSDRGNILYDALEGLGQFVPQVALSLAGGAAISGTTNAALNSIGRASLTAAQANKVLHYGGTFTSTYLQTYGNAYEEMLEKTGDRGTARAAAFINSVSAASAELFLPDTKIASKFRDIIRTNGMAESLTSMIKKGGTVEALKKSGKPLIQNAVNSAISFSGMIGTEVLEEEATLIADFITESIFSPKTASNRNFISEAVETAKATALSMSIPALFGGIGARSPETFNVQSLHQSAISIVSTKKTLEEALDKDQITQDQFDKAMSVVNTHRESIRSAPKAKQDGKLMSSSERLEYAYQDTLIKELKNQESNATSDVTRELIQSKIKAAEDVQREIAGVIIKNKKDDTVQPWTKRVQTVEEQDSGIKSQDDVESSLRLSIDEEKNKDAALFIKEMIEEETLPPEYSDFAKKYPLSFLRSIAEQSQGYMTDKDGNVVKHSVKPPRLDQLGNTILNYANSLFKFSEDENQNEFTKEMESEVDQVFQGMLLNLRSGLKDVYNGVGETAKSLVDSVFIKMNNADYINEKELDHYANKLYEMLDAVDKSEMSKEGKSSVFNLVEPLINKIEQYEFRTETKTSRVAEEKAVSVDRPFNKSAPASKSIGQWTGSYATFKRKDGSERTGLIKEENGSYYLINEDGNKVHVFGRKEIVDRDVSLPPLSEVPRPIDFDENGDVSSITLQVNKSDDNLVPDGYITIKFRDKDAALDYAIRLRAEQVGEVDTKEFDTVYEQIEKEISEEVLKEQPKSEVDSVGGGDAKAEAGSGGVGGDVLLKDIDKKDENYDSIEEAVKGKNFVKQTVRIDELVAKDKDLQEYLNDNNETKGRKIEKAIIVGDITRGGETQKGGVIDGFHRIAQAIANGETTIDAFVEQSLKETPKAEAGSVGVVDVKLEKPSAEQQLKDIQEGNMVTFEYKNESEVPEVFKDKISSKGEINGKTYVKVTMAKSLADYHLQEQSLKETPQSKNVATKEVEEIKSITKPELEMADLSESDFDKASSFEMEKQGAARDRVMRDYDRLKQLIECIWT